MSLQENKESFVVNCNKNNDVILQKTDEAITEDRITHSFDIFVDGNNAGEIHFTVPKQIENFEELFENECFIDNFYLKDEFRDVGFGRCIYNYIEDEFISNKCRIVKVESRESAIPFWKKMGFDTLGEKEYNDVEMFKDLFENE
jgi:hypothetical protein